jgi:chemotaxis receptor (MCP) glutamine deamidase CheD
MLNTIVPLLAFLFFVVGAALLNEGMSASGLTQTAKIIGGASLLSLGSVTLWVGVKNWWKSRIVYKEYRNE